VDRVQVTTRSGQFPDSQLKALQGLGRNASLGLSLEGKGEAQKLALLGAGYRILCPIHPELKLLLQKPAYACLTRTLRT
jgi:hypothetical protein